MAAQAAGEAGEDELAGAQRRVAELERKIGQQCSLAAASTTGQ